MFPPHYLPPQSTRWAQALEQAVEALERRQPGLTAGLQGLQRENNGVMQQVMSRINAYYNNTLLQYPVTQFAPSLIDVLGGNSKTVSISAPAAAINAPENWVSIFSQSVQLPAPVTSAGARLNSMRMLITGSSTYTLRFRWVLNGSTEGINDDRWMSRHLFNLTEYSLNNTPYATHWLSNRYAYWTGSATSTMTFQLQASIQNPSSRSSAVAAQNIVFGAVDISENVESLDVTVYT